MPERSAVGMGTYFLDRRGLAVALLIGCVVVIVNKVIIRDQGSSAAAVAVVGFALGVVAVHAFRWLRRRR